MFEKGLKMHLRTMICLRDIGLFDGEGRLYGDNYSGNHIVVFETELKEPSTMSLIDGTDEEFMNLYRINLNKAKIVDVDNFMRGNSYFTKIEEEAVWRQRVSAVPQEAPIYKEKELKSVPHYQRDNIDPMIERYWD